MPHALWLQGKTLAPKSQARVLHKGTLQSQIRSTFPGVLWSGLDFSRKYGQQYDSFIPVSSNLALGTWTSYCRTSTDSVSPPPPSQTLCSHHFSFWCLGIRRFLWSHPSPGTWPESSLINFITAPGVRVGMEGEQFSWILALAVSTSVENKGVYHIALSQWSTQSMLGSLKQPLQRKIAWEIPSLFLLSHRVYTKANHGVLRSWFSLQIIILLPEMKAGLMGSPYCLGADWAGTKVKGQHKSDVPVRSKVSPKMAVLMTMS